ncbi:MAG: PadR family transcriptional regulator [Vicinamibacterales bacterium]
MAKRQTELLKGTLDMLVLKTLELEPRHGVAIADRIAQVTRGVFAVKPGSLFPALHRLEQEGLIRGAWGLSDQGRRTKAYDLTAAGRKRLAAEKRQWTRIVLAVGQVLEAN